MTDGVKVAGAIAADAEGMCYLETLPRRVVTLYIPLALFVIVLLFPFYWMGVTTFKPNDELYKNPGFGYMYTAGSNAVTSYFKPLRLFGAQVRKVLLANAASHWNVPIAELTTGPNVVIHEKSGRKLSYGEIATFAEIPAEAPAVAENELKPSSRFRLIGGRFPHRLRGRQRRRQRRRTRPGIGFGTHRGRPSTTRAL